MNQIDIEYAPGGEKQKQKQKTRLGTVRVRGYKNIEKSSMMLYRTQKLSEKEQSGKKPTLIASLWTLQTKMHQKRRQEGQYSAFVSGMKFILWKEQLYKGRLFFLNDIR